MKTNKNSTSKPVPTSNTQNVEINRDKTPETGGKVGPMESFMYQKLRREMAEMLAKRFITTSKPVPRLSK